MTPKPQEAASPQQTAPGTAAVTAAEDGERVVISGMAGLYPQARYVSDLERILYDKINPVTSDNLRWKYSHPEVAQYAGNVPELNRFDAQFFKVHFRLGSNMDPMSRKMLELTFEAIYDSGINPDQLSGKKVCVFVGSCFSEAEKLSFYGSHAKGGLGIAGCSKSMFANRISYWLNAKGSSVSIDQACCSSMAALEAAYTALSHGECEAAIVGGANLGLHPQCSVHYGRIMNISMDGKTKSFDEHANGCAKSEAINVLFLQKAKYAKRIYADVLHVKSEFVSVLKGEIGPRYGFYRQPADSANFMKSFYEEAGISPAAVEYVEAFGSAVPEADRSELEAIDKVFCSGREEPLLVGSVMSNIGYGEAASGISAISKVLLAYQKGSIAGNLHCTEPRRDVAALREGRMCVLTEHARFRRTYVAVNSMSVTGVNAHVLLKGHYKPKDLTRYKCNIPRLVTISGRQESAVERALDLLKSHPIDPEELALLHNIHETNITGHLGKGYTILDTNTDGATTSVGQRVEYCDGARRPLWFVYSGMGSQWAGMGAQLMRIPIFAAAIERCHKILEPRGLDIVHIITSPDKTIFNNILHSFVGIAAVQIGLTDILLQLGLIPDNIIGHSVGELGCAYADGCLTAEEMILSAYSRGRVSLETPFIRGSMAAVGLGAKQMSSMCPPEITIACHNSAESCTISGPADVMRAFVADLTARGIFAKEVPCSNIAYHSRYIAEAGPGLLKYLKEVIKTPRERSSRWVSSSVARERWEEPAAKYSSAEYHTNNLLSPVLFEEASALIPADAVLVEVAPHGLLQAILKRALPDSAANIPLTRRSHTDSVTMLLDAIGKLYIYGYYPKVRVLYPEVEFPVSTGTPFLSHFVEWAHEENWPLPLYESANRSTAASCTLVISTHDVEHSYLNGHVVNNKTLLPFSFALVAVWDTLSMSLDQPKRSLNVEFSDVTLYTQPILHDQKTVTLSVSLQKGNGRFEVMEGISKVASGRVVYLIKPDFMRTSIPESLISENIGLRAHDVYRILYERGYGYHGLFHSIIDIDESVSNGNLVWNGNWVTFIDGLFQLNLLKYTHRGVSQPYKIGKILIDVSKHRQAIDTKCDKGSSFVDVHLSDLHSRTRSGGVMIENVCFQDVLQVNKDQVTLQALKFVPRFCTLPDVSTSLSVLLQIVAENSNKDSINVLGLSSAHCKRKLYDDIEKLTASGIPGINIQYNQISLDNTTAENEQEYQNVDVIVTQNLLTNNKISESFHRKMQPNTFILNEENINTKYISLESYKIVAVLINSETRLELAYWQPSLPTPKMSSFTVHTESDLPLLEHARSNMSNECGLLILTSHPPVAGLMSLVKQWRREPNRNRIHLIVSKEDSLNKIALDEFPDINLAYNVLDNTVLGGDYYIPLEDTLTTNDVVTLQSEKVGDLNSLHWVQANTLTETGTLVTVHYTGLNMGDVKQCLGLSLFHKEDNCNRYGMEFSGVNKRGEKVMGLVPNGAASSYVIAQPDLMWPVPEIWSLEDAATVPFAYMCAYYCLVLREDIRPAIKDAKQYSVLVHGGAGALGQAAINIALARGWRVFTTVSDQHKKRFLLKLFPQLNEHDIGNSRDGTFGDMVLAATNGIGCNVVICCVKGELKNISFNCGGPCCVFFDTVQLMTNETFSLGMNYLTDERSYVAVDIKSIINNPKSDDTIKLHALVSEGIANGEVRPLTRVTFAPHEAARAFRLLAASNHRGRVLLRLQDELAPLSLPTLSLEANSSHLLICDSNTIGLQVTEALIDCGIKNIHLHCYVPYDACIRYKKRVWKSMGIELAVTHGKLNNLNDIQKVINSAIKLGSIESLHLVTLSQIQETVLSDIDSAIRTICPTLKRFVVLTNNMNRVLSTCIQRANSGLPATLLDLAMLDSFQDANGGTWYRGVCDALKRALQSVDTVLLALPKKYPQRSLIQEIATITDTCINISNKTKSSTSLEQLGLALEKSAVVCSYLRDVYHCSLNEEDVPHLSIDRINQIQTASKPVVLPEVKGLGTFYSFVDPDELLATSEMVLLPTLTNNSGMRDDEFDASQTFLCIVPGLEGLHARFRTLCERLKLPAIVLQPGLDRPWETPKELAIRYYQVLLKKFGGTMKTFYILGYETGVLASLELAAILENDGVTGTVFCVGEGPLEMQALLERELADLPTEAALQEAVMRHMFALMAHGTDASADDALRGVDSWAARKDACVRALLGYAPHSAQYAHALLETAYARIVVACRAVPEPRPLRSRIVLLRARGERAQGETCSLQQYTQSPLVVEELAAPMAHVAADLRAPSVINSYLDEELLRAFHEKNLCDTYLTNADNFMSFQF